MAKERTERPMQTVEPAGSVKRCFIATPIGEVGTPTRHRADQMFKYVLEPAARECGYAAIRADQMPQPGLITSQILQHIVDDELVLADLTDHNPNVFYELAIRHAVRKPVVQVIHKGLAIPFDLAAARTVQVDIHDLDSVADAKRQIIEQIRSIESGEGHLGNPITEALQLKALHTKGDPTEFSLCEMVHVLNQVRLCLADLDTRLHRIEETLAQSASPERRLAA